MCCCCSDSVGALLADRIRAFGNGNCTEINGRLNTHRECWDRTRDARSLRTNAFEWTWDVGQATAMVIPNLDLDKLSGIVCHYQHEQVATA